MIISHVTAHAFCLHRISMSEASGHITANASQIASSPLLFAEWAQFVKLDPAVRDRDSLPLALQRIIDTSRVIPRWITQSVTCSAFKPTASPKLAFIADRAAIRTLPTRV
jgi:hypothetical protein